MIFSLLLELPVKCPFLLMWYNNNFVFLKPVASELGNGIKLSRKLDFVLLSLLRNIRGLATFMQPCIVVWLGYVVSKQIFQTSLYSEFSSLTLQVFEKVILQARLKKDAQYAYSHLFKYQLPLLISRYILKRLCDLVTFFFAQSLDSCTIIIHFSAKGKGFLAA